MIYQVGTSFLLGFGGIIVWETLGRKKNKSFRPSLVLDKIQNETKKAFEKIGRMVAYFSAFLIWLELEEIGKSITDIMRPSIGICASPYYFLKGYYQKAKGYVNRQYMVYIGSGILGIVGLVICQKIYANYGKNSENIWTILSYFQKYKKNVILES